MCRIDSSSSSSAHLRARFLLMQKVCRGRNWLAMVSAQLMLQRPLLITSPPCFSSAHRRRRSVVLRCSCTSALSIGVSSGRPFRSLSILQTRTADETAGWNHHRRRLKATSDEDSQLEGAVDAAVTTILGFVAANFLPLVLLTGVTAGLLHPRPGQVAQQWGLARFSTSGIFFLSGLTLKTGDMLQAASAWPALLFGMVSILFITPLVAIPVLRVHLTPKELVTGLAIFCCVPTTLSSGVSLTQLAGANTALALALTVSTNLLGILTMPFMLTSLVGWGVGVSLPAGPLLKALVETLLIPLLLGKLFREFCGYVVFLDEKKRSISMISSSLLALVPWMQASCSRDLLLQVDPIQLLAASACGIGIHTVYLVWNSAVMWLLPAYWGNKGGDQVSAARAVILVASQKTLPVIVAVVANLNGVLGEGGLLVLPCIATHLSQIIFDSVLVSYWLDADKSASVKTA